MSTAVLNRDAEGWRAPMKDDDPDPRLLQGAFTVFHLLAAGLAISLGSKFADNPIAAVGLGVSIATLGLALVTPWRRLPRVAMGVLPALDTLALGLSRLNQFTEGAGAAIILLVVPGLWLGWLFGRRGAYVSIGFVIALAVVPAAFYFGFTGETIFRSFFVTVVSAASALLIAISLEKAQAAEARARKRGVELTEAVAIIEKQRRMAEAILESVDVGLVLLDSAGRYQQTNRRHLELLELAFPDGHSGYAGDPGEIYGPDGTQLIGGAELPSVRALIGNEFDDERIWIGNDPLTRRAVSVSARRVLDARGNFEGAALAYNDVTDYVNLLKVKDEFLASVSHELRTPLTSIMGYVDLLIERDDLPEEAQQHLAVVERNSTRLLSLVADLLHTAQIDQGPMRVVRKVADLSEIARESVGAAEPHALGAGIKLELDAPEQLWASVDAQRMGQVFDNLLSNAIKYTPAGGMVRVRLALDLDRVEIEVTDSGIGIEASDRDRLFTRFFRARDAEARSIQGVGLGLSVLKSIIDGHGGRVEVESQLGVGSTFRVRLPLELPAG